MLENPAGNFAVLPLQPDVNFDQLINETETV